MTFQEYYEAKLPAERRLLSLAVVLFSIPFECKGWIDDHAKCDEEEKSAYYLTKANSAAKAYRLLWFGFIELVSNALAVRPPVERMADTAYFWLKGFFDEGVKLGFYQVPWGVGSFWSMHMRMMEMSRPHPASARETEVASHA